MSDIILSQPSTTLKPLPSVNINIRPAVLSDVVFMDSLQKLHSKAVGFMPTGQLEGNVKAGRVLIAEEAIAKGSIVNGPLSIVEEGPSSQLTTDHGPWTASTPIGYCLANDRYFKHDDVGIIYQMNIKPGKQRSFVGGSLLKAQFERSAYGCKLYCCWCAQDLAANKFWEAMGFVPLAFRTGSEKKSRIHIFWQKRIRQGDTTTPWWFPSKTTGGAVREDRIVLPIPPGQLWSDAKPLILPSIVGEANQLPEPKQPRVKKVKEVAPPAPVRRNGLMFAIPQPGEVLVDIKPGKAKKEKPPKVKRAADPRMESAARELRDRWLEQINATPLMGCGKYEVSRIIGVDQSYTASMVEVVLPALPEPIAA